MKERETMCDDRLNSILTIIFRAAQQIDSEYVHVDGIHTIDLLDEFRGLWLIDAGERLSFTGAGMASIGAARVGTKRIVNTRI